MSATDRPSRSLEPLLAHPEHAGVYHLPHSGSAQLEQATQDLGYAQYAVDLGDAADLDAALSEIGRALAFPDWYGHNLDALHDCLGDMESSHITLRYPDAMMNALGVYGRQIIQVFQDSAGERNDLVFVLRNS